jgi:glycosyltransferase involved in cell wall biosynthesis
MKFLFVSEYFPPYIMGGAEISLKILVDELLRKGHDVVVLTPNYGSFKTLTEKKDNLKIVRFRSIRYFLFNRREKTSHEAYKKTKPLFYAFLNHYVKYSTYEIKIWVKKILKNEKFDMIHANNLESILAVGPINTSSKKIAHLRDFGLFCYNRGLNKSGGLCKGCSQTNLNTCMSTEGTVNKILNQNMKKRINNISGLSDFDFLIAISNFVKEKYIDILQVNKNKIKVLYNPISDDIVSKLSKKEARSLLNLPEHKKIVLYAGSLTEEKGAYMLSDLSEKLKDHLFIVIGNGILKELFLKKKQDNLRYLGYLSISELKDYYRASDILVVPSLWYEPFGRVVLEGAYNGCYVIGSDRGGIPEVIDWLKCGIYTKPTVENFVKEITGYREDVLTEQKLEDYDHYEKFMELFE